MEILTDIRSLGPKGAPLHLAIGVFDGIHLGHQAVIEKASQCAQKEGGEVVVVTFDPHPAAVLSPQNAPRLLTSTQHKAHILFQHLKIRKVLAIPFTKEFSEQNADQFIEELCAGKRIKSISVGKDFRFGKSREGSVEKLRELGASLRFQVNAVEIVKVDGITASSTRVREAIAAGDFEVANALLGRKYTVLGTVIEGRKMGRTIGFPTANLTVHSEQLPPTGVYAVRAIGAGDSWDGIANLGYRPTVEGGDVKRLLEVHLFGLEDEIYGEDLEVDFVQFLRGEQKFEGLEELKTQIAEDIKTARRILEKKK